MSDEWGTTSGDAYDPWAPAGEPVEEIPPSPKSSKSPREKKPVGTAPLTAPDVETAEGDAEASADEHNPLAVPDEPEAPVAKPAREKRPVADRKPPRDRKKPSERNAGESGEASAATADDDEAGNDKKTRGYNNPERVRTGGTQRDKLSEEELTERMTRMREQNEKIKQRRMDVLADEDAFKKTQESERVKLEKIRKEQEQVNRTREQNAQRKMAKVESREWDAGKRATKPAQGDLANSSTDSPGRGRGGGRGGTTSVRGRGRGRGDSEAAPSTPAAATEAT